MPMKFGYTQGMRHTLVLALALGLPTAQAGGDPDLKRRVPEAHQRYTGARLAIGTVAEAFLLQHPGHPELHVSASRYNVDLKSAAFGFRNRADFPISEALQGQWLRAVFLVNSVTENAVESPAGSGNWSWILTYECELQLIELAKR
jgi:hypothetical protein